LVARSPRTGQINAWDNPAWVQAIKETRRKTLLIAGTLTSVCMAFPALSALVAGYKVFTIVDASGNWSKMATDVTMGTLDRDECHGPFLSAGRCQNQAQGDINRGPSPLLEHYPALLRW
jgi:hypothetical protein